ALGIHALNNSSDATNAFFYLTFGFALLSCRRSQVTGDVSGPSLEREVVEMLLARSTYVRLFGVASLLAAFPSAGGCIIDPNLDWTSSSNAQEGDSGDDEESGEVPEEGDSNDSGAAPETGEPMDEEGSTSAADDGDEETSDSGDPGDVTDAVDLSMRG